MDSDASGSAASANGYTAHRFRAEDDSLDNLLAYADVVVVMPSMRQLAALRDVTAPLALFGGPSDDTNTALLFDSPDDPRLIALCQEPRAKRTVA